MWFPGKAEDSEFVERANSSRNAISSEIRDINLVYHDFKGDEHWKLYTHLFPKSAIDGSIRRLLFGLCLLVEC